MGVYKYDANGFVIADRNRLSNYRIMDILPCAVDFNNLDTLAKSKIGSTSKNECCGNILCIAVSNL